MKLVNQLLENAYTPPLQEIYCRPRVDSADPYQFKDISYFA
jgi:hypothetical protein